MQWLENTIKNTIYYDLCHVSSIDSMCESNIQSKNSIRTHRMPVLEFKDVRYSTNL